MDCANGKAGFLEELFINTNYAPYEKILFSFKMKIMINAKVNTAKGHFQDRQLKDKCFTTAELSGLG